MTAKIIRGTDLLVSSRAAVAGTLQGGLMADVAANHPRLQTVTAANLPALAKRTGAGNWYPVAVDPYRNLVLGAPNQTTVYSFDATSADAAPAQTKILDLSIDFPAYYALPWYVFAFAVTETAWFAFIGYHSGVVPDGVAKQCAVIKCTNFASPAWSEVHSNLYGSPANVAVAATADGKVAYGVYKDWDLNLGAGGQNVYKATVYLSEDDGATWQMVMSIPSTELVGGNYLVIWHVHGVCFDPADPDRICVILGDRGHAVAIPPAFYNCSRSGGVWTATELFREYAHSLCHHAGEWYTGQWAVSLLDVATGRRNHVFRPPLPTPETPNYPYQDNISGVGYARSMSSHGGVLYAAYMGGSIGSGGYDALMASVDGRAWSCVARLSGTAGYHWLLGYAGGKMWIEWTDASSITSVYSFDPLSALAVNAVRIERARSNLINIREDSTFVTAAGAPSVGHWAGFGSYLPSFGPEAVAGLSDSDYCMHYKTKVSSEFTLMSSAELSHFGTSLASGDYFCMSARAWSPNTDYRFTIHLDHYPRTNISSYYATHAIRLSSAPQRIWLIGKCTGAPSADVKLWIYTVGPGTTEVIDVYVDQIAWYKSTTEWPEWDEWQRGDVARPAENLIVPLGGLPAAGYTICWDWIGGLGPLAAINHPILTLVASDGTYLEASWVTATNKVQISNGTTTATMGTALVRLREDVLRFVLTYKAGVGHTLTMVDPLNGQQSCTADFSANFTVTNPPVHCQLGASLGGITEQGHGLYWGFSRYPVVLTAGEITTHLVSAGAGLVEGAGEPSAIVKYRRFF